MKCISLRQSASVMLSLLLTSCGSSFNSHATNDMWSWTGGANWVELHPHTSPPARALTSMAYDPIRKVSLLFGGQGTNGAALGDTWTWDGATWTEQHPPVKPPARFGAGLAFDTAIGKVVLFGGTVRFAQSPLNDTWTWDGGSWMRAPDEGAPPSRHGARMVYDEVSKKVLLYGGTVETEDPPSGVRVIHVTTFSDTWAWDGNRWMQVASEPQLKYPVMAYDAARGKPILYGDGPGSNTWSWDGTGWTEILGSGRPIGDAAAVAYDPGRRVVVALSGVYVKGIVLNDTWTWDGTIWRTATTEPQSGPTRYAPAITYDDRSGHVIIFGGEST